MKIIAKSNIKYNGTTYEAGEMLEVAESQGKKLVGFKVAMPFVESKKATAPKNETKKKDNKSKSKKKKVVTPPEDESSDDATDEGNDGDNSPENPGNDGSDEGENGGDEGNDPGTVEYPEGVPTRKWLLPQLRSFAEENGIAIDDDDNKTSILKKLEE